MKHILIILLCFLFTLQGNSQDFTDLVSHYDFDECTGANAVDTQFNVFIIPNPDFMDCRCGIGDSSMYFDGIDDGLFFLGTGNDVFTDDNFTLSFYMRPLGFTSNQVLFFKGADCNEENVFSVHYNPSTSDVTVKLAENPSKIALLSSRLDLGKCWQHVAFVRKGANHKLYLNGREVDQITTNSRVDLSSSNSALTFSDGECLSFLDTRYNGLVDEVKIFDEALERMDIEALNESHDVILTRDTLIFLGNSVDIVSSRSCADNFSWFPTDGIDNPTIPNPVITPTETMTYSLDYNYDDTNNFCIAFDSIRITVVDPEDLDCSIIYLPKAFTPNADGLNDDYGISNPYAVQDLISLEVFDRWGSNLFITEDPFVRWDGAFKGKALNPGVFLYRIRYKCDDKELIDSGSFSILK